MLFMANFDASTPFLLLARIHVKPGCVDDYLSLAATTDAGVKDSELGCCITHLIKIQMIPTRLFGLKFMLMMRPFWRIYRTPSLVTISLSMQSLAMALALRSMEPLELSVELQWQQLDYP